MGLNGLRQAWRWGWGVAFWACASVAVAAEYRAQQVVVAGASWLQLWDIDNRGAMVGGVTIDGLQQGILRLGTERQLFTGPAGSFATGLTGISETGLVVGNYWDETLTDPGDGSVWNPTKSFLHDGSGYQLLQAPGAISTSVRSISNDGRYLSGIAQTLDEDWAWRLDRQTGEWIEFGRGFEIVIAQGVRNDGSVLGTAWWLDDAEEFRISSFRWNGGAPDMLAWGNPVRSPLRLRGVNEEGLMTGFVGRQAFIGTLDSYSLVSFGGATSMFAYGINESGIAVGYASMADESLVGLVFAPVPEPGAWALMVGGLGMVAWRCRARGRQRVALP